MRTRLATTCLLVLALGVLGLAARGDAFQYSFATGNTYMDGGGVAGTVNYAVFTSKEFSEATTEAFRATFVVGEGSPPLDLNNTVVYVFQVTNNGNGLPIAGLSLGVPNVKLTSWGHFSHGVFSDTPAGDAPVNAANNLGIGDVYESRPGGCSPWCFPRGGVTSVGFTTLLAAVDPGLVFPDIVLDPITKTNVMFDLQSLFMAGEVDLGLTSSLIVYTSKEIPDLGNALGTIHDGGTPASGFVPAPMAGAPVTVPPVANAGPDQSIHLGSLVALDGSASSDPSLDYPLSYHWEITSKPALSTATPSDPTIAKPTFVADALGDYVISLVVTNKSGFSSDPDEVKASTYNNAPVADAGMDQAILQIGTTVQLDGTKSYDTDGDSLTYLWTMTAPAGSAATLLPDRTIANPTFVADVYGSYMISLVVTDQFGAQSSNPAAVTVSFTNLKPVANAGGNQVVAAGSLVSLDGSASSDANGDPLTYAWSIVSKPNGSGVTTLTSFMVSQTSFVADLPGTYVVSLVVSDGFLSSDPSNATVTATWTSSQVTETLKQAIGAVNALGTVNVLGTKPSPFKNPNMRNALTSQISAVIALVEQGNYKDALQKLRNDILQKTNGCAAQGSPDKNDWIMNCTAQEPVYLLILHAIELLAEKV